MRDTLTWLHISDIHFHPSTAWRDDIARVGLIEHLRTTFAKDDSLRPDLVFCTGDIAFGETGGSPLADQYGEAREFFDALLAVCGRGGVALPRERLFTVPGNHDVNRRSVNSDAQTTLTAWARNAHQHIATINHRFEERTREFTDAIQRLDDYSDFVRDFLPHQVDADGRLFYARVVEVDGLRVGVAGFNSAWTCAGPEDDRALWMAAQWQLNAAAPVIRDAAVRIGLVHHPISWLNEADRIIATRRISTDFDFWLHGHEHNAWVEPAQSHVTIAAGAVGAGQSEELGVNLVHLDRAGRRGTVHLSQLRAGDAGWTIAPVAGHAPAGQWAFDLPETLLKTATAEPLTSIPPDSPAQAPPKRTVKLYGREKLLDEAAAKLRRAPFLLVYGLRGIGKTALIEELSKTGPLAGKDPVRLVVNADTTADELFRQLAPPALGETAEFPKSPQGNAQAVEAEIRRRYPEPRAVWIWLDRAHNLLDANRFHHPEVRSLLLGLQAAMGDRWHWVLELRERPQGMFNEVANTCEVPGLDRASLGECLADAAPEGREADWRYTGQDLKRIYRWLGGSQGNQAHPFATQLLIEVARARNEAPLEVLERHLDDWEQRIEDVLLGDLYENVLNHGERCLLDALALYRAGIPHDHLEELEHLLKLSGAWDGLDRRCLLAPGTNDYQYYLHSFISGWLRTRRLGYAGYGEDDEADFADTTEETTRQHARDLHSAIATCWLGQLRGTRRLTNVNIMRAVEAFHHLVAAGDADRVQGIAVELLRGKLEWARRRMKEFYDHLFRTNTAITQQRRALQYRAVLDPDDHAVQRFLGRCWQKEEGKGSDRAVLCFENACRLRRDFPPYWADLGNNLLARGRVGASDFLSRLESLEQDCPQAIDGHVRAIQSDCLKLVGHAGRASALRMAEITAGSRDPAFYNDEAKARLEGGDIPGALEILDLAEKNGRADDFTKSIRASVLQRSDPDAASALRMAEITAGSRHPAFYNDEAKARLEGGDIPGALEILDLAEKNGRADDFTKSIRASVLQRSDPDAASALRMAEITAGSRNPVFYNDEAKARLEGGDIPGALEILELVETNGCANEYTKSIYNTIRRM